MNSAPKQLWYFTSPETTTEVLEAVYHRAFDCLALAPADAPLLQRVPLPRGLAVALRVGRIEDLAPALDADWGGRIEVVLAEEPSLLDAVDSALRERDIAVGLLHSVVDDASLQASLALAERVDVLVLDFQDPTNIPLELILATTQGTQCTVVKRVRTAQDGISSAMTMEHGADGIALETADLGEIVALEAAFTRSRVDQLSLVSARVTAIRQAGMGDRICVDTTSELGADEGMLLGSTSAGGLLICSETHFLPYMELRPFRVNAGSLHHYIWAPGNRTFYLSELRAGMEVLAVNAGGAARTVTIGRLKIERRPLLLIEAEAEGERLNVFVQDDWHVRLMGEGGAIRPSREIAIGDLLLAYRDRPGRHVGIAIDETIREV